MRCGWIIVFIIIGGALQCLCQHKYAGVTFGSSNHQITKLGGKAIGVDADISVAYQNRREGSDVGHSPLAHFVLLRTNLSNAGLVEDEIVLKSIGSQRNLRPENTT